MTHQERKKNLEDSFQQKFSQLQRLNDASQKLANEIVGIQANIKLIDEFIKEDSSEEICQKEEIIKTQTKI